jgi:hypothetical protein
MGGRFSVLKTRPFSGPKNEAELRARKQGRFLATLSGSQKSSKSSWESVPTEPVFRNVVAAIGPHFWASCPGSHAVPGRTAASRNIHKAQGNRASFNVEALPSQLHHMCHRPSSTPQIQNEPTDDAHGLVQIHTSMMHCNMSARLRAIGGAARRGAVPAQSPSQPLSAANGARGERSPAPTAERHHAQAAPVPGGAMC